MAKYQLEDAWNRMGTVEVAIIGTGVVVVGATAWAIKNFLG